MFYVSKYLLINDFDLFLNALLLFHCKNLPMQYTEIFLVVKNLKFQ